MLDNGALVPRALTIAGSDSGGGAGIQADLKTFAALGVYGMSAITAVTAQNTVGVRAVQELSPETVAAQIDAVCEDIGVDAAKTGMLASAAIIETVAEAVKRNGISKLVVDPVMVAKSGDHLLEPRAASVLSSRLLPLAHIVTPNIPEAETLTGVRIETDAHIAEAARLLLGFGPRYVLIKGGHREGASAVDWLFTEKDQRIFKAPRIDTQNTHGTGCTYSAAIAAFLARGAETAEAVSLAKTYVTRAIESGLPLGKGHGPLNHFVSAPFGHR